MEKQCSRCKETKPVSSFSTNGKKGLRSECKLCRCEKEKLRRSAHLEAYKERDKQYYQNNKEEVLERNRKYRQKNCEAIKEQKKQYYQENKDKAREWHEKTKPRRNARLCERRKTDAKFALITSLRGRVSDVLRRKNVKDKTCWELLGCHPNTLWKWFETQFTDEMSWDNYSEFWHADHVIPVAFFDVENETEKHTCFHWSNLKPLNKIDNIAKRDKILPHYIMKHHDTIKQFANQQGYQTLYENTWWPRLELGYGKNPSDGSSKFAKLLKWAIRSQDANLHT